VEKDSRAETGESADPDDEIEKNLEELYGQVVAERDLRKVLRWASTKILGTSVPLGENARQQLVAILIACAKAGSILRLRMDTAKIKAVYKATVVHPEPPETAPVSWKRALDQIKALRAAILEAGGLEASMHETLKSWREQFQSFVKQSAHTVPGDAEQQEKMPPTIAKAPSTDGEWEELESRTLYIDGISSYFSKDRVTQLLSIYGEVVASKVISHSRNHETCWSGVFAMATSKAADAAKKALNSKVVGANACTVDKPRDGRPMGIPQEQPKKTKEAKLSPRSKDREAKLSPGSKKDREAKLSPRSKKDKEQEDTRTERRLDDADREYLSDRLQRMGRKERNEVADIISADIPGVKGALKHRAPVDLDELSNPVLLKLLAYFWGRFCCPPADPQSGNISQLSHAADLPQIAAGSSKQREMSRSVTTDSKGGGRTVTKWDLLRGLRADAEKFLKIGTTLASEQRVRFNHPSVMSAPNLPTGAYTILRDSILADNVGTLLDRVRDEERERPGRPLVNQTDGEDVRHQAKTTRVARSDPVARRWKALKRDYPTVAAMASALQFERSQVGVWTTSGHDVSPSRHSIVAANDESADAIAQALRGKDPHVPDNLAAFTKRLAEINKDARFHVKKVAEEGAYSKERRRRELLESRTNTFGQYPGLVEWLMLKTEMPYLPDYEERW
jgi:hypothetical protein